MTESRARARWATTLMALRVARERRRRRLAPKTIPVFLTSRQKRRSWTVGDTEVTKGA